MLATVVAQFTAAHPDLDSLSPREKALELARWLQINDLTGIEAGREYHALEHNFLGLALQSPGHNSLPLISAAIYCYAAQELGLNAHPCGFPFHVHVIITPQPGFDMNGSALADADPGPPMYLDPFRGARETPVSDLRDQLVFLGVSDQTEFLGNSRASDIVLRCSKNILNSIHSASTHPDVESTSVDMVSAKYAALWSSMLLSGESRPMDLRHQLPWLMELFATDYPSDIFLVEQYIVPLFHGLFEHEHILESLHVMRAVDEIPKQVRRRTKENKTIQYKVGQVFRHRRYHYRAIITGWDSECGAGEQWMRRMGIDRLQAGRHQSFYHVL
jgi:F-box protein 21